MEAEFLAPGNELTPERPDRPVLPPFESPCGQAGWFRAHYQDRTKPGCCWNTPA